MNYFVRQICITELLISVDGYDSKLQKKVAHAGYPSPGPRPCCTQFYALSEANILSYIIYLTDFSTIVFLLLLYLNLFSLL